MNLCFLFLFQTVFGHFEDKSRRLFPVPILDLFIRILTIKMSYNTTATQGSLYGISVHSHNIIIPGTKIFVTKIIVISCYSIFLKSYIHVFGHNPTVALVYFDGIW